MNPYASPSDQTLSLTVVVPCFNERATIEDTLRQIATAPVVPTEIILVDDASTDGTFALAANLDIPGLRLFQHEHNRGKGAALRTGLAVVTGDIVLIQDADLEYSPMDYPTLLQPILDGRADVVFGSRFTGSGPHRVVYFWHMVGNRFLTLLSNMFTNLNLTDMETGYKVFRREIIQSIEIEEDRFGVEPEITAKIARTGCRIYEIGISYFGRTYAEGKKIGWRDGFRALYAIVKYGILRNTVTKSQEASIKRRIPATSI